VKQHRTSRAFRPGCGWCSRCWCGWTSERDPGWVDDVNEARALGLVHEVLDGRRPDWSVPESWLRLR
jgi:hypothetical protein